MKVPSRQSVPYGCGYHALANLFGEDSILLHIKVGEGSGIWDLNEALRLDGSPFYLVDLIKLNSGLDVQNRFTDTSIFAVEHGAPENVVRPFLISIKGTLLHHCLLILHDLSDNKFFIVDSLKESVFKLSIEELVEQMWVTEIMEVRSRDIPLKEDKCLMFNKSAFKYLSN